jgi:hypothetical protein
MDAELIAIGRVRRAVRDLPEAAQARVLQYVVQGLYERQNEQHRAELLAQQTVPVGGSSLSLGGARMSEATSKSN